MIYKVLNHNGSVFYGGVGAWSLPNGKAGSWISVKGKLVPCENGIHLCDGELQLLDWLGPAIFEAEYKGGRVDHGNKIVVRRARLIRKIENWNDRTARLFACGCAERALNLVKNADDRSWLAIAVARKYALGHASSAELAAAWDAARAAAWDAAGDAAWDAAWRAARAAAGDTAWAAAWAADWRAARGEERRWQAHRLRQYLNGEFV